MVFSAYSVVIYIICCCIIGTRPCKYFQLNSKYFDENKGIFSKITLDQYIPERWRLPQFYLHEYREIDHFPVFVKPEWGQNSKGIVKIETPEDLSIIKQQLRHQNIDYILQQGAQEPFEFEIFSIAAHNEDGYRVLTVTQVINRREKHPVNGIFNPDTEYVDVTYKLNNKGKQTLWSMIRQIGKFGISRVSVKAYSLCNILQGEFHVIEVNLFNPMPINILDKKYTLGTQYHLLGQYMVALAKATKNRDRAATEKPVFIKQVLYNQKNVVLNFIREKI